MNACTPLPPSSAMISPRRRCFGRGYTINDQAAEGWKVIEKVTPYVHAVCRIAGEGSDESWNRLSTAGSCAECPMSRTAEGVGHGPYDRHREENSAPEIPFEYSTLQPPFSEEKRSGTRKGGKGSAILIALPDDCLPVLHRRYGLCSDDVSLTNTWGIRKTNAGEWSWKKKGKEPTASLSTEADVSRHGHRVSLDCSSHFAKAHTPGGGCARTAEVKNGSPFWRAPPSYQGGQRRNENDEECDSPPMGLLLTTSFVLPNTNVARTSTATFMEQPVAGTAVFLKRSPHAFTVALRPDKKFVTSVLPQEPNAIQPLAQPNRCATGMRHTTVFSPLGSQETSLEANHFSTFGKFSSLFAEAEEGSEEKAEEEEEEEIGYTLTFVNINPIPSSSQPSAAIPSSSSSSSSSSTPYPPCEKEEHRPFFSSVSPSTSKCPSSHCVSSDTPSFPSSVAPLSLDVDGLHLIQPLPLPLLVSQLPRVRKGDMHLIVTHMNGHRRAYVPLHVSNVYEDHCEYEMDSLVGDFSSGGAVFDRDGNFVGLQHQCGKVCIALFVSVIVRQLFQSDLLGCCRSPIADVPFVERHDSLSLAEPKKSVTLLHEPSHILSPSRATHAKDKAMQLAGFEGTTRARPMPVGVSETTCARSTWSGNPMGSRQHRNSAGDATRSSYLLSHLRLSQESVSCSAVSAEANRSRRSVVTRIASRTPGFEEVYREFFTPFALDATSSVHPFTSSPGASMMESEGKRTRTASSVSDTLAFSFQSLIHMLFGFCYSTPLVQHVLREIQEKKYASLHPQVGRSGGIGVILELLDENLQNQTFVESCLSCLAVLCLDVGNLTVFIQLNGVVSVMTALSVYRHYSPILQWGVYCVMHATNAEGSFQSREAVHAFLRWDGFGVVTYVLEQYGAKNGCLAGWVGCLLDHLLEGDAPYGILTWMLREGLPATAVSFFIQHVTDRFVLCGFLPFLRHVITMIQKAHDRHIRRQEGDDSEGGSSTTHEKEREQNALPFSSSTLRTTFPLFYSPPTAVPLHNNSEAANVEHQKDTSTTGHPSLKTMPTVSTAHSEAVQSGRNDSTPDGTASTKADFLPHGVEEHPNTEGNAQEAHHTLLNDGTADSIGKKNSGTNRVLCHPFCGMPCIFADFLSLLVADDSFMNALQYVCHSESEGRLPRSPELLHYVADILNAFFSLKMVLSLSFISVVEKALYRIKKHLPIELELAECYQAFLNLHSQFAKGVNIVPALEEKKKEGINK